MDRIEALLAGLLDEARTQTRLLAELVEAIRPRFPDGTLAPAIPSLLADALAELRTLADARATPTEPPNPMRTTAPTPSRAMPRPQQRHAAKHAQAGPLACPVHGGAMLPTSSGKANKCRATPDLDEDRDQWGNCPWYGKIAEDGQPQTWEWHGPDAAKAGAA